MEPEREGPTLAELLDFASRLPEPQARELLARARPAPLAPEPDDLSARPPPIYRGWSQYLRDTTPADRLRWCAAKARTANRPRLMSGRPDDRVTAADVWDILQAAEGRGGSH